MTIHLLRHLPFDDIFGIAAWARARGHHITETHMLLGDIFPRMDTFDMLVELGGFMSVPDEAGYPWLTMEKALLHRAAHSGKPVLVVCLGAQMLAEVLGGTVGRNPAPEIGWHTVRLTFEGTISPLFGGKESFTALQWHGDTFSIPDSCTRLADSVS